MLREPRKTCVECKLPALYGPRGSGPLHCEEHQTEEEINLVERYCTSCKLLNVLNPCGLCMYCDPEQQKVTKAKELTVKQWLDAEAIQYLSHDRMIDRGACIKNRPDFIFDANTHMVVLEVDEHQHQSYPCECEQARMVNISQALGMPTVFVRYNPDPYQNTQNRRVNPAPATRKKELLSRLQFALKTPPTAFCEVIYVYYDGYTGAQEPRQTVME